MFFPEMIGLNPQKYKQIESIGAIVDSPINYVYYTKTQPN